MITYYPRPLLPYHRYPHHAKMFVRGREYRSDGAYQIRLFEPKTRLVSIAPIDDWCVFLRGPGIMPCRAVDELRRISQKRLDMGGHSTAGCTHGECYQHVQMVWLRVHGTAVCVWGGSIIVRIRFQPTSFYYGHIHPHTLLPLWPPFPLPLLATASKDTVL